MKKRILSIICVAFVASNVFGQKSFSEVDSETFSKKATIAKRKNDASGQAFSDLTGKELKKVALISFVAVMPPDQDKYGGLTITSGLEGNAIKQFANELHDYSTEKMKAAFKAHGAELLTLDDMSNEQKSILNEIETSKWINQVSTDERISSTYISKYQSIVKKTTWDIGKPAYDYKSLKAVVLMPDDLRYLGLLCKALKVDAVLIVNNKFDLNKGAGYQELSLNLIGENPISYDKAMSQAKSKMHKRLIAKNYWDGVVYTESVFQFKKPVVISERNKKEYTKPDYTGFGSFMYSAIDASLKVFEERTK